MNAEQAIDKALAYLRDESEPMPARAALAQAALSNYRAKKHYESAITGANTKRRDQLIAGLRKSQ
jgi:hypothetical protein